MIAWCALLLLKLTSADVPAVQAAVGVDAELLPVLQLAQDLAVGIPLP
jgi:hypothetical protein